MLFKDKRKGAALHIHEPPATGGSVAISRGSEVCLLSEFGMLLEIDLDEPKPSPRLLVIRNRQGRTLKQLFESIFTFIWPGNSQPKQI
jgi:hypothetical protein